MTRGNDSTSPILDKAGRDNDGVTHFANVPFSGLTKRELFAAMAMQGIISNRSIVYDADQLAGESVRKLAVQLADALIEALNERKEQV